MENLGLLSPNLIACHCVHLTEGEMDLLAERGVRVVHNPESNMKLASGVAPIPDLLKRGIPVGLGTDGCASNNNIDLFQEMDFAAKVHKVHRLDPTVMPAETVLEMATLGGARVLGMEAEIGSFLQSVRSRKTARVSGRDGKRALEVALQIVQKIQERLRGTESCLRRSR